MGKLLYNLSIFAYLTIIKCISPFNRKANQWITGRKRIFYELEESFEENKQKIAWFHCASLGEFEQGRPLIEKFRIEFPYYKILLTFFSPSGYEIRKNYPQADYVFYLPIDNKKNARKFLKIVKPEIAFFIKYEFWYNYIREVRRNNIPIISVSAIFRENQLFFKPYGKFYIEILKMFNHIFVQNEHSKELLEKIKIKNITVAGDTRFDRVKEIATKVNHVPIVEKFRSEVPLLVAGSTWPADMEIIIPFINSFDKPLKFIFAPHEINSDQIDEFLRRINKPSIKFSQASFEEIQKYEVLFMDNVGMLSSIYQYADYAYIGGGFGKGIHNILEAAVHGVPVVFGPQYQNFKEARDLLHRKSAYSVTKAEEFAKVISELYTDPKKRSAIQDTSLDYIEENTGATFKVLDYCKNVISQ